MFNPVVLGRPICISKTNFIKIGQVIAIFSFFKAAILDFRNSQILLTDELWDQDASSCQISSKSIHFGVIAIFTFLADRTIGRAYATVSRLSVVRRPSSVRL